MNPSLKKRDPNTWIVPLESDLAFPRPSGPYVDSPVVPPNLQDWEIALSK